MQDGWMEQGDDDDAPSYPPAPLPPHERTWRHPSELGPTTVTASASAGLGRGVTIAVGVFGVAVAIVMIRLMSPGSPVVEAGPATSVATGNVTTTRSVSTLRAPTTLTAVESFPPVPTTSPQPVTTVQSAPDSSPTATSDPGAAAPETNPVAVSTTLVGNPTLSTVVIADSGNPALLWFNGSYAIAGADGLALDQMTSVLLESGETRSAAVVHIADGLAVIALGTGTEVTDPGVAELPGSGSELVVESAGGAEMATLSMSEGDVPMIHTTGSIPTGCPVRNLQGALLGVTVPIDGEASRIVTVAQLDALVGAAERVGGWLGITGENSGEAGAVVRKLAAGSPAVAGGMMVADRITRVDDVEITSVEHLASLLRTRRPGTAISIVVTRGEATVTVVITLAERASGATPEAQLPAADEPTDDQDEAPEGTDADGDHSAE